LLPKPHAETAVAREVDRVFSFHHFRRFTMANSKDNNQNQNTGGNNESGKSGRGFASMDSDRQREIAAEGGRAAHASGNAHEFNSEEAREAGSKSHGGGGNASNSGSRQGSSSNSGSSSGSGTRGGSSEQHARAGSQSHKNDR
jgi:uncharacterized protein